MNARGEPGYDSLPPLTDNMRRAAARLAGVRGRAGTAARKERAAREAAYRAQTGRRDLTPAQARRARKKGA